MILDLAFDIYSKYPWFSSIMHLLGGLILGLTFFSLLNYLNKEKYFVSDKFIRFVFTISLVALFAVFWEFYEFSFEKLFSLGWHLTYEDTIWDLFVDLVGGVVGSVYFILKSD
jgi:hypothetical protein